MGTQFWIPACAGMSGLQTQNLGALQGKAAIFTPANSRFMAFHCRNRGMFIARSGAIDD
jgi:hypothetical protein